jgi:hypothetical protein
MANRAAPASQKWANRIFIANGEPRKIFTKTNEGTN